MAKGDKFGIVMQNHPEFVDLMVASTILGTVFVPIDPRTRGEKLKYMLEFAECKGAFVGAYALAEVEASWGLQEGRWISTLGETDRFKRMPGWKTPSRKHCPYPNWRSRVTIQMRRCRFSIPRARPATPRRYYPVTDDTPSLQHAAGCFRA